MSSAAASPALVVRRSSSPAGRVGAVLSGGLLLLAAMLLVAVVVAGANGLRIRVEQTGSMAPALQPGDLVVMEQIGVGTAKVGDVIGVRASTGQVIVHRVERIDGASGGALRITTRGDANPTSETWTIPRSGDVALVRGSLPSAGSIVDALKGPYTAVAVLLAGLLLAFAQLRSIWRPKA